MKIDSITNTYKVHNEDIYGNTKNSFWVLDGALPLSKAKFTNEYSDVIWMVNWWNNYLLYHIDQFDKSIVKILEEGVILLNTAFAKYADSSKLSKLDRATASITIVRMNGETIENYVLGDSEINIRNIEGEIDTLIDEKIEKFDSQAIDMIFNNSARKGSITFNGYTDEELKVLRNNRMKMNTKDGYYILEHDKEGIKHGIYKEYKYANISDILLMSDGYSAIYNKYNQMSIKQLMDTCKNGGVKKTISKIREIEENDADFKVYKRLRLHDDATALYINI